MSLLLTIKQIWPQGCRSMKPCNLGGILFGAQWLIWKSLLDRGESAQAADLAARVVSAYEKAVTAANGFPEALNADTGLGVGRQDSSGDACALIALHAAYHRVGTISCGWDVNVLDDLYDKARDYLRLTFRAIVTQPKGVILCVMGKPGAQYHVTGGISGDFTSDGAGALSLPIPNDKTTQQVEITPAGTAAS